MKIGRQIFFLSAVILSGCESAAYVPPTVSAQMAGERAANIAFLQDGRRLFANRCIECHTLPPVWHYQTQDWPKLVDRMSHRASLKPAEREAIISYILAARRKAN